MGQYMDDPISVLLPDGTVLVGGSELYEPLTKSWTTVGGPPRGPDGGFLGDINAMLVLRDGKVFVLGGHGRTALYDPTRRSWTAGGIMVTARSGFDTVLLADGKVLIVGGNISDDHSVASAELYDPVSGSWTATGSMLDARSTMTATLLPDGRVLVVGAFTTFRRDVVPARGELYDPASGTWSPTADLVTPRFQHTATRLTDGRVLVAGGSTGAGDPLTAAELYDPVGGTWTATAGMVRPHEGDTATLLADGRVLVTGQTAEIYDPGPAN
jgi:hypothetical protein